MEPKYLNKVILNADVYAVCLQHALSTEKEEVMGLLIGNVDETTSTSHISACTILRRIDKQPDRVEISSEQLLQSFNLAEKLSNRLKKELRVIGWYHSHPHITVWPSHVDIKTQALYQMMERFFVGLIFSVFPKNAGSVDNQVQVIAFQSLSDSDRRLEIKLEIADSKLATHNLEALSTLPKNLVQEEKDNHKDAPDDECDDFLISMHNEALKTLNHVHIVSKITRPICEDLEKRLETNRLRIAELKRIVKLLERGQFA
ncbi:lys-63-specific deubiquitinase BRCC36-like [Atheta coriaria]|uniref:lys-63-specific deubiquitinase BRCC36-like n=1 Tax=Dalotia coriaria TaxID=877792 RepID=UPI0031F4576D